ncbi:MAG TPA: hypothetical protein QGF63_05145 [Alphaproteobacteria bacterium]|jgi:hypothetical protein|nr:hypothetical protein [Alphaproteobacteria bacterium]MDP6270510.1 hypothetical protein [Alphaproteobacteria bacterium]HJM49219.1 hypothetical protein [Alphaproteobacteria bacterium]
MKVRVYVGTTEGPVQVERITREAAPQSAVCLGRSTRVLPMSTGYDAFVRPPSGVIEREFGPFDAGGFRLDVSGAIGQGESWQLGIFVAHALAAKGQLASPSDRPDRVIWLTGEVDNDLAVQAVSHVRDKLLAAREELQAMTEMGVPLSLFAPVENCAAIADMADEVIGVRTTDQVLAALEAPLVVASKAGDPAPQSTSSRFWLLGAVVLVAALTVTALQLFGVLERKKPPKSVPPQAQSQEAPPPKPVVATAKPQAKPGSKPEAAAVPLPPPLLISIIERREPEKSTCAAVHFRTKQPTTRPVAGGESGLVPSRHEGLCGLAFEVVTSKPLYVSAALEMLAGRFIKSEVPKPADLDGARAFQGRRSWLIDVPSRHPTALVYRLIVIAGTEPLAGLRLPAGPRRQAALAEMRERGLIVELLEHQVVR